MTKWIYGATGIAVFVLVASLGVSAQQNPMTFFITSAGPGNGANLGGLAGADKVCQTLAAAAGAGNRTWRAYLSAAAANGQPAVNARDRIGKGPWTNAKGVVVAKSVADLHSDANLLGGENSLTEKRSAGCGRPARYPHRLAGRWHVAARRCAVRQLDQRWGNRRCDGRPSQQAGRRHRAELVELAHSSRGCSQQNLIGTGGNGYFYCFAN
jgi:hypothetical protein